MSAGTDDTTWQWALGVVVTAFGLVAGAMVQSIRSLRGDMQAGDIALWNKVDDVAHSSSEGREKAASLYATRDDVAKLRSHFDARMDTHEERMRDAIQDGLANRSPVRRHTRRRAPLPQDA